MNPYFLDQLARERQAEFRREAEMERKARKAETGTSTATRRMVSMSPVLVVLTVLLVKIFV